MAAVSPDRNPGWRQLSLPAPLLLAPILVPAAFLRVAGLQQRGLIYWDEAKFALEGIRLLSVLRALPLASTHGLAGKAVGTAKPTHALFIAAAYALFGVHDYVPLYLNAVASLGAVLLTYLLGTRLFGRGVGLLGAAVLAVSGYDVVYARSALSESDADLLLLAGALLWLTAARAAPSERPRQLALSGAAGIVLGAAFTTNYRMLVYIAALLLVATIQAWRRDRIRSCLALVGPLLAGLLVLPGAWQFIGTAAQTWGIVLFRGEITYRPTTYLGEVLYQLHGGRQSVIQFNCWTYAQWYVARQGWPLSLFLVAGLGLAARRRTLPYLLLGTLIVLPYAAYSCAAYIVPRNLDAALPFAALLSAATLREIAMSMTGKWRRTTVSSGLPLVLLLSGVLAALPYLGIQSGFATAATYLTRQGISSAVVDDEVLVFYLRDPGQGCDAPPIPWPSTALPIDVDHSVEVALLSQDLMTPAEDFLLRHAHLLGRFPALGPTYRAENVIASENGAPPARALREWVLLFSLRDLRVPHGRPRYTATCSVDRLA